LDLAPRSLVIYHVLRAPSVTTTIGGNDNAAKCCMRCPGLTGLGGAWWNGLANLGNGGSLYGINDDDGKGAVGWCAGWKPRLPSESAGLWLAAEVMMENIGRSNSNNLDVFDLVYEPLALAYGFVFCYIIG
jgi:hypothetical protein